MNRAELVDALVRRRGVSRRVAEEAVNLFFEGMKEALVAGRRIEIRGFGTFKVRHYEGYVGRNPKTGRPMRVPPKRLPVFKLSRVLKAQLARGRRGG